MARWSRFESLLQQGLISTWQLIWTNFGRYARCVSKQSVRGQWSNFCCFVNYAFDMYIYIYIHTPMSKVFIWKEKTSVKKTALWNVFDCYLWRLSCFFYVKLYSCFFALESHFQSQSMYVLFHCVCPSCYFSTLIPGQTLLDMLDVYSTSLPNDVLFCLRCTETYL